MSLNNFTPDEIKSLIRINVNALNNLPLHPQSRCNWTRKSLNEKLDRLKELAALLPDEYFGGNDGSK